MSRRLVITADDLGRDPGTNATIAHLVAEGLVSATTIIPVSPHADEALESVRGTLVPHLHVTLSSEDGLPAWPLLADGEGLEAELEAQLAWLRERDVHPVAADSHAGTLYEPARLPVALEWCARHSLAFRLPRDASLHFDRPPPEPLASAHAQAVAYADALGVALPAAILTNRRSAGEWGGYDALRGHLIGQLRRLPEGTSELFLHPSTGDDEAGGPVRAWEARLLRDPAWHAALEREHIEVVDGWWS